MSKAIITPYGSTGINSPTLDLKPDELQNKVNAAPSLIVSNYQLNDLELLLNGAFTPLRGFMEEDDYNSVVEKMLLCDGTHWPLPICLDISDEDVKDITLNEYVVLCDQAYLPIALMLVNSMWQPDTAKEIKSTYGTLDKGHQGVLQAQDRIHKTYIGGPLHRLALPAHYGFTRFRHTPSETRMLFKKLGWSQIIAYQTRNPLHRMHVQMIVEAARRIDANVLIHPAVGCSLNTDIDDAIRTKCYLEVMKYFPGSLTQLSLLPLSMRMAGPKEALLHGLIRRNYGCSHMLVGRGHANPSKGPNGIDYYEDYEAQDLFRKWESQLGIKIYEQKQMAFDQSQRVFSDTANLTQDKSAAQVSGAMIRKLLRGGENIPEWYTFPEVKS